jgi:preprotein translocase subunit YajC
MPPFFAARVARQTAFLKQQKVVTMNLISPAYAQAAAAPASGGMSQILILVVFVAIFYFMLIRPQQKRAKEQQAMLAKLAAGDEVVTSGGILGKLTEVGDSFVTLEIAENVRIRVQRGQISQLMPKGTLKGA